MQTARNSLIIAAMAFVACGPPNLLVNVTIGDDEAAAPAGDTPGTSSEPSPFDDSHQQPDPWQPRTPQLPPPDRAEPGTTTSDDEDAESLVLCGSFSVQAVLSVDPAVEFLPTREWSISSQAGTLYVHLVMLGMENAAHQLTLDFYVPDGYLYRRDTVKVLVGEVSGGIQGYPWEYVDALAFPEGWVVSYALPLASDIASSNSFGGWRLAVMVDGDPNPAASVWFEITPE